MSEKIVQTAGRNVLREFAPDLYIISEDGGQIPVCVAARGNYQ